MLLSAKEYSSMKGLFKEPREDIPYYCIKSLLNEAIRHEIVVFKVFQVNVYVAGVIFDAFSSNYTIDKQIMERDFGVQEFSRNCFTHRLHIYRQNIVKKGPT